MNCNKVLDTLYYSDSRIPFVKRLLTGFHIWHCPKCAAHWNTLQKARACMREDFFPPATSGTADQVMALIRQNEDALSVPPHEQEALSFRVWVAAGLAILFSLSSAYLGIDYLTPAGTRTINFMLPIGITVGAVITAFGAIFIGSHIKELSKRLGLRF
ncbi:MAG: peptidoglycan-binding protein [Spirochaetaceae bacterium]|jgi:anti-sigma factor RsiW|nr:peptidoglycan-binding protein [Spirochaetaceae bacterium]